MPADPESKGGSEATVRIAKADLVPTDANLRGDYTGWAELAEAGEAFTAEVNARGPSGDPAAAGGDADRGTAPSARAARGPLHGGAGRDPEGLLELDDQLRRGDLTRSRTRWPMRRCGCGWTVTTSS